MIMIKIEFIASIADNNKVCPMNSSQFLTSIRIFFIFPVFFQISLIYKGSSTPVRPCLQDFAVRNVAGDLQTVP